MAYFIYKARDNSGLAVNGTIEAESEMDVISNLSELGYQPVRIEKQNTFKLSVFKSLKKWKKISQTEIIHFTRQMSVMLKAGLPLTAALIAVKKQVKQEEFIKAIDGILQAVEGGEPFSEGLNRYPKIFKPLFVNLIKVGEATGKLDEMLTRIYALYSQEYDISVRVRSALLYPMILVMATIGIVTFLITFIIPKFVIIFETYDATLPLATRILLGISLVLNRFWWGLLILAGGCIYWFKGWIKKEEGLYKFHHTILKLPVLGEFYIKHVVARFTRVLGTLIKSGVPIMGAFEVTEKTVSNVVISSALSKMREAIAGGEAVSQQFEKSGLFPDMVVQMIAAGEKSGTLDQMLIEVADYYDQEIEYAVKNLTTVLEPVLLLVMGSIVAFIALSVLLPIFNLIRVFRGGL